MQAHRRTLVSEAEFLALPESTQRVELLDGEVIVSSSPTFWHQEILRRLLLSLGQWAARQNAEVTVGQSPLDVRFGPDRILQPDAFVAGVREYWVVEPAGLVERFSGAELTQVEEVRGRLTTSVLPGYELDLEALFRM